LCEDLNQSKIAEGRSVEMPESQIFRRGRSAVIMGAASGIGLAAAAHCVGAGMRVVAADFAAESLERARESLQSNGTGEVETHVVDVGDFNAVKRLHDDVIARHRDIALLMNNAGHAGGAGAFEGYEKWRKVFATNFWGVVHGVQAFTPALIEQKARAAIVNTGSKQGITNPPGDLAYNATKSAVKTLTEGLAHALRAVEGSVVTAHLLIPGFTYTALTGRRFATKPDAAWTPEQVVEFMATGVDRGDFYILCPDNETTPEMDARRILWSAQDITQNRPALSRWHPDFKEAFGKYMSG
jgi:NAD(P)-dependent dehydrogenase (short-subunit alcohol dehydrogenase family)